MCASRTACSHVYYGCCVATTLGSAVFVLAKTVQCQFLDEMAVESLRCCDEMSMGCVGGFFAL